MGIIVFAVIIGILYAAYKFAKNPYAKFMSKNRWDIIQTLTGMFVFIVILAIFAVVIFGIYAYYTQ